MADDLHALEPQLPQPQEQKRAEGHHSQYHPPTRGQDGAVDKALDIHCEGTLPESPQSAVPPALDFPCGHRVEEDLDCLG